MRRTTLVLDERQFAELKSLATAEGRTLSSLTKELLGLGLAKWRGRRRRKIKPLPTWDVGEFMVDVADRDALHKAMEGY